MKEFKRIIPLLFFVFGFVGYSSAQTANDSVVTFVATDKSSMKIAGTSTVHDWEADVEEFTTVLKLAPAATDLQTPKSEHYIDVMLEATVKKIESGKSGMNSKIYKALNEKAHPKITFSFDEVTGVSSTTEDTTFTLSVDGKLTVSGNTRNITITDVKGVQQSDNVYRYTGSTSMKMSSFDVEPPSAMFGAIKAGDEITISFDLYLRNANQKTASR